MFTTVANASGIASQPLGLLSSGRRPPAFSGEGIVAAAHDVRSPAYVVRDLVRERIGVALDGRMIQPEQTNGHPTFPLLAALPPLYPEWLGAR